MAFKLVDGAQKNWRRIDGHNQLSKLIHGIRFTDGIEVIGHSTTSGPSRRLTLGRHQNSAIALGLAINCVRGEHSQQQNVFRRPS